MQQLDAFAPYTDTPRARRSDPETSHLAAERIRPKLRKQQQAVLDALARWPGSTAVELAKVSGLDRYLVSRRLPELTPIWVRRGRPRACSVAGTIQGTWYVVDR
jgi:hypothetical protein